MGDKLGVFICKGLGIGDALDVDALKACIPRRLLDERFLAAAEAAAASGEAASLVIATV